MKPRTAGILPAEVRCGAIDRGLHEGRNELRPYILILLLSFGILACKEKAPLGTSPSKQNVILISIDTVRADYLKLYNPSGASTPNLEEFSKGAVLFKNVISQVPYTLPSHCTILTGYYPATHRVRDNVHDILPANIPTLAEIFQKAGYQTAGFVGSMVLSHTTGLARGFSYYDDLFSRADVHGEDLGAIERPAEDVLASFKSWFGKRNRNSNFFAFVHFYDPHSPYTPPSKFAPTTQDPKEQYKGEIRYVDSVLGNLFSILKNEGIWGSTVVLITSDHGEMLNEHQEIGHGFFLYQPALQVPMLLYDPQRQAGKQIAEIAQLVDIVPTLLDSSRIKVQNRFQGESLIPLLEGKSKKNKFAFSESYFASLQFGVSPLFSVQDLKFKYIQAPNPELFDLNKDASESRNLYSEQRSFADKLLQKVAEYKKTAVTNTDKQQRSVSAEEQEQFAALGYLGGSVPEKEWNYNSDPKDFIDDWNASLEATMLLGERQFDKALGILDRIRSKSSSASLKILTTQCYLGLGDFTRAEQSARTLGDTPEGYGELAEVYAAQGKKSETENAYKRSLEKQFSFFVLYNYTLYLKGQGKTTEALALVREAQKKQPDNGQSRSFFSEAYFLLEDFDASQRLCAQLIEDRPWELKWYLQISTIYQKRGELQRAISLMEANHSRFHQKPDYFLRLGILYKLARSPQKEMEAFKEMLRLNPQDPRGYFYLAKTMLDQRQDLNAVVQLTGRGLQLSPDISMQIFGHYILSEAYEVAGRKKESMQELQTAQKLERS